MTLVIVFAQLLEGVKRLFFFFFFFPPSPGAAESGQGAGQTSRNRNTLIKLS